jgi:cytoskeletal protein CcmA (bactofilin family)
MNHFDEMTCILYLDGQLAGPRAEEIGAHARQCPGCAALLAALQRESNALREALVTAEDSVPARVLAPPSRDSFSWAWLATLGFSGAGVWMLWTGLIEPWQQQLAQAGFGGGNVISMLLFGGVFWEGWANMLKLVEAMAVIALGLVGLTLFRWSRRRWTTAVMVFSSLALVLLLGAPAMAQESPRRQAFYSLPADEVHEGDLFVKAVSASIDGTVKGDLIFFCQDLTVNGRIEGDLIVFAQSVRVAGEVDGNIRSFAQSLIVTGRVTRNITAFVNSLQTDRGAETIGSVTVFGDGASLHGKVGRGLRAFVGKGLTLNGPVTGDIHIRSLRLAIGPDAVTTGSFRYRGKHEPEVSERAQLASPVEHVTVERKPKYSQAGYYFRQLLRWAAALLLGLVILWLAPGFLRRTVRAGREPGSALGLILLPGVFVLSCIVMLTFVGLALGITTILLWGIAWYASQIFVGVLLGELILGRAATTPALVGRMALGILILRVVIELPLAGWWPLIAWLLIGMWGMGAMTLTLYRQMRPAPGTAEPAVA